MRKTELKIVFTNTETGAISCAEFSTADCLLKIVGPGLFPADLRVLNSMVETLRGEKDTYVSAAAIVAKPVK